MTGVVSTGKTGGIDPYVAVRAQIIARQWDNTDRPRDGWFQALAKAGLMDALAGSDYGAGLKRVLIAAEIFGAYALPLSFAPAAALLGVSDNAVARAWLVTNATASAPVLVALGGDSHLSAVAVASGGISISGQVSGVPDALVASGLLVEAALADGKAVFFVSTDMSGITVTLQADVTGGQLGAFDFNGCIVPAHQILGCGEAALDMQQCASTALQLGLAAELAGVGATLMIHAGSDAASERDIADALMDVTLARALVFGVAGLMHPGRAVEPGLVAGARVAASNVVMGAARLALASGGEDKHRMAVKRLARRAIALSHLFGTPQLYMARFAGWRWNNGREAQGLADLFAGTSAPGQITDPVAAAIASHGALRALSSKAGLAEDHVYRDLQANVELALMGLVCADAQHRAGGDISLPFLKAAARRMEQHLADCALYAAGSDAALADKYDFCSQFLAAYDCKTPA